MPAGVKRGHGRVPSILNIAPSMGRQEAAKGIPVGHLYTMASIPCPVGKKEQHFLTVGTAAPGMLGQPETIPTTQDMDYTH